MKRMLVFIPAWFATAQLTQSITQHMANEISGFTSYYRSCQPSHHNPGGNLNATLVVINKPTRTGKVMVVPGDSGWGRGHHYPLVE